MYKSPTSRQHKTMVQTQQIISACCWCVLGLSVCILQGGEFIFSQNLPDTKVPGTLVNKQAQTKPGTQNKGCDAAWIQQVWFVKECGFRQKYAAKGSKEGTLQVGGNNLVLKFMITQ